ncbi:MAG: hypothetical protein IJ504_01120 [Bacteroidales bacterium]|nr:hypothetical protein [Bacteroidales bacterium]
MGHILKKAWPRKNLKELIAFIEEQHGYEPSLEELSQKTGLSVANISAIFIRDDMKLSRAEAIARKYGHELKLFFPLKEYPIEWESHISRREFPNAGNLSGLIKYMYDSNISINHMSRRINRSHMMINKAFSKGDIFISSLNQIIDNLNIDVIWMFEKMTKE